MKLRRIDRRRRRDNDDFPREREPFARLLAGLGREDWTLDLVLVDDGEMADLNATFRGGDGVTDVLSFSYLLQEGDDEPDLGEGRGWALVDLWADVDPEPDPAETPPAFTAGEVILAPGFIVRRCREKGWSTAAEFPLLVVHGALHVLGWEHDTENKMQAMRLTEAEILGGCGLPHPLLDE